MVWLPSCDIPGSTVKVKNLDPVWDETFDLPVAKPEHASLEASPFVVRSFMFFSLEITCSWLHGCCFEIGFDVSTVQRYINSLFHSLDAEHSPPTANVTKTERFTSQSAAGCVQQQFLGGDRGLSKGRRF